MAYTGGETGTAGFGDTGGQTVFGGKGGVSQDQTFNIKQRVGTSDITLFTADEDKGGAKLPAAKSLRFTNEGNSVLGIQIKLNNWESATAENTDSANSYLQFIINQGEAINFPMSRIISSSAD